MKIDRILSLVVGKVNVVFEVTGVDREGFSKWKTYLNGGIEDLPELVSHFDSLNTGSIWSTVADKNGVLGKRTLICRKAIKFRS